MMVTMVDICTEVDQKQKPTYHASRHAMPSVHRYHDTANTRAWLKHIKPLSSWGGMTNWCCSEFTVDSVDEIINTIHQIHQCKYRIGYIARIPSNKNPQKLKAALILESGFLCHSAVKCTSPVKKKHQSTSIWPLCTSEDLQCETVSYILLANMFYYVLFVWNGPSWVDRSIRVECCGEYLAFDRQIQNSLTQL